MSEKYATGKSVAIKARHTGSQLARQARTPCQMLYLRWLETLRRYADCPAIYCDGKVVTFADLAIAVSLKKRALTPVIARSGSTDFFVDVLRAWRDGQPVIPLERDAPEPVLKSPPPAGTYLVKYTPGASGTPRGIFFNAEQIAADGDRIVEAMSLSAKVPNLSVISLAHSYGFSNIALPLILHGVPLHLAAVPFPRVVEEIFRSHSALTVPAVPSMWRAWHRAGILKNSPVSFAISAGAPLALALENEIFSGAKIKIHNFYGASECGGISLDLTEFPRESGDDVGTPLPGVLISREQSGRLLIRSDSVAIGYDFAREDDRLENGSYLTRDLGNLTNGRIFLTGTIGGSINVAGRKVSPAKVEAALLATGSVLCAKVLGIPSADQERCEEILAEVTLAAGASLTDLKSAVTNSLQAWEIPRHWKCE
ncbi:MAG: long-chain fatty acid--CoA ligase [Akkermansiaceae bacterium]|nr:long-chain fatty acid--CoA ligase [Akkermansiaceae bacterium]